MALADILSRIEADGRSEAEAVDRAAAQRVEGILERARTQAAAHTEQVVGAAERDARRRADTTVVAARLAARDQAVAARRALVDEAIERLEHRLATLPDDRYARLLAARIAASARGGEVLRLGTADAGRSDEVLRALAAIAPDLRLEYAAEPAPFERGALLEGERVRADLSLSAIVDDERDRLEATAGAVLFPEGE